MTIITTWRHIGPRIQSQDIYNINVYLYIWLCYILYGKVRITLSTTKHGNSFAQKQIQRRRSLLVVRYIASESKMPLLFSKYLLTFKTAK